MSRFLSRLFLSKPLSKTSSVRKREQRQTRPSLEPLEDRLLLASPVVTSTFDDPNQPIPGINTLRDAIGYANSHPGSDVTFQSNVTGTISLGKPLTIAANMTISGPGANTLGVSAANAPTACGIFTVNAGVTAEIDGLQIGGNASNFSGNGGAILNKGYLTLGGDVISYTYPVMLSHCRMKGGKRKHPTGSCYDPHPVASTRG